MAGIRTVFLPSPANPLVALRIFFQVGAVDDPAGKEGLALLTADDAGQGRQQGAHATPSVLDALYPLAAQIRVYGDKESIVFEGTVHRDNLARFADLLADQVLTPRFADDDFTRNRQDALDYITKTLRGNDDEDLGKQAMATMMYRRPSLRPAVAGDGRGPERHHARGRAQAVRVALRARSPGGRRRGRLSRRLRGGVREALRRAARQGAAAAASCRRRPCRKPNQLIVVEKDARAHAISIGRPIT